MGLLYELASRWEDATLAGSETILRSEEGMAEGEAEFGDPGNTGPLFVIPDSRGRTRFWSHLRTQPYWRDVVALCSRSTPRDHAENLRRQDVECIVTGEDRVDLRARCPRGAECPYGVEVVRAESGGTLNGVLLRAGLVDEASLLVHPSLVGGTSARSFFRAPDLTGPEGLIRLRLISCE